MNIEKILSWIKQIPIWFTHFRFTVFYISVLSILLFNRWVSTKIAEIIAVDYELGIQLEISSLFAAGPSIIFILSQIAQKQSDKHKMITILFLVNIVITVLVVADIFFNFLKLGDFRATAYLISSLIFAFLLTVYDYSDYSHEEPNVKKIVVYTADIPLVIGLSIILLFSIQFSLQQQLNQDELDLFIGGAQTLKVIYYQFAYGFIKVISA